MGGELTDLLLVLRSDEAVRALCGSSMHIGIGGHIGAAVGPLGRDADAAVLVSGLRSSATAPVVAYSCSRGAFLGVSVQVRGDWSGPAPSLLLLWGLPLHSG